ncbi:MAG: single-stranded DNA-binding protein [Chromatiales bacterium 21-64-14]|nr:MAG: single-stranded DNA-binding protein [Chromatiales bacterium 21-64-14]HQU15831.1 uracil-DNA glycosylase family protein [Gammaproteobacteria bacterium]
MDLVIVARRLGTEVAKLRFAAPVTHVYNPLEYAWRPHQEYLRRYGSGSREVVLVGMNPGPWGMAQTGVPFGDVELVRGWLGIEAPVTQPRKSHPKRPVTGFACPRGEVSGRRLWGWARDTFDTPRRFFARFLVINYCPLCFMEDTGRNRTPDKLSAAERERLFAACDAALVATVRCLRPRHVLGIGRFAEGRIRAALADADIRIGAVPHPSPASPSANRGWARQMDAALQRLGIQLP